MNAAQDAGRVPRVRERPPIPLHQLVVLESRLGRMAGMKVADTAIRQLLATEVLRPTVLERALDLASAELRSDESARARGHRRAELTTRLRHWSASLPTRRRGSAVPAVPYKLTAKTALIGQLPVNSRFWNRKNRFAPLMLEPQILRRQQRALVDD